VWSVPGKIKGKSKSEGNRAHGHERAVSTSVFQAAKVSHGVTLHTHFQPLKRPRRKGGKDSRGETRR